MRKILFLKAWQLFVIVLVTYLPLPSPIGEIVGLSAAVTITLWQYSVGYYGEQKLRLMGIAPKNLLLFQVNCIYIIAVVILSVVALVFLQSDSQSVTQFESWMIILIVLFLYLVFAAIQVLIFTSQTLAELEIGKPASFREFRLNLLLFVIFVVGVWILTPKVRRYLVEEYNDVNPFESI
jgi:hypothetical protein